METLNEVLAANAAALMPNGMGQKHSFVILARKVSDGEGGFKLDPIFHPDPNRLNAKLKAAGLGNQPFLRVYSFVDELVDGGLLLSIRETFRTIFKSENMLYSKLLEQFYEGHYEQQKVTYPDPRTGEELIRLKMNTPIYGETVTINFPAHYAMSTDQNGNQVRLRNISFVEGDYKEQDTVLYSRTFFFFAMEPRATVITRYFNRFVKPFRAEIVAHSDQDIAGMEQGATAPPVAQTVPPQQPQQPTNPPQPATTAQQPNPPKSAELLQNQQQNPPNQG